MSKIIDAEHKLLLEDEENRPSGMSREKLDELKASVLEHGLLQNLEVVPTANGRYKVIIGNRRTRATGELIKELPELIEKEADVVRKAMLTRRLQELEFQMPVCVLDDDQASHALERQLVENLQREDVSPVDEAFGYQRLKEKYGLSSAEIAKRIGKERTKQYVDNRLKLLRTPKPLLEALKTGVVTVRSCERVGRIPAQEDRDTVVKEILNPRHQDEPLRDAQIKELIGESYVIPLRDGGFNPDDAELLPMKHDKAGVRCSGGACSDCPFRTGNDPALADELSTATEGKRGKKSGIDPNLCTNPACFRAKRDAAWAVVQKEAKSKGQKALSEEEAKKVFGSYGGALSYNSPFEDLDEKPGSDLTGHYDDAKVQKWDKLLEDTGIPVTMARNPKTGKIHRLVDQKQAVDAVNAKYKGQGKPSPFQKNKKSPKQSEADKKKKAAERDKSKLDWQTTYEQILMTADAAATLGINEDRAQVIAEIAVGGAGSDGQFVMCKVLQLEPGKTNWGGKDYEKPIIEHLKTIKGAEKKLGFAIVAMTMRYAKSHACGTGDFNALAKAFDVDRKSAEAIAKDKLAPKKPAKEEPLKTVTRSKSAARNQAAVAAEETGAKKKDEPVSAVEAAEGAIEAIKKRKAAVAKKKAAKAAKGKKAKK